jgi:hypothetical protein
VAWCAIREHANADGLGAFAKSFPPAAALFVVSSHRSIFVREVYATMVNENDEMIILHTHLLIVRLRKDIRESAGRQRRSRSMPRPDSDPGMTSPRMFDQ